MVLHLPDTWSNSNLKMLVFEERRKPKDLEKNLLEQRRELTNSAHKSMLEFEAARPDWWEASTLTITPPLLTFYHVATIRGKKISREDLTTLSVQWADSTVPSGEI